jgi:D-serine deaminase-like pyridoxal phosphate-dependent protein
VPSGARGAARPRLVSEIPTPALVLDIHALGRNIVRMARFFSPGPCRLRPHFKAHKTREIARRQLAAGSCVGLTCATVSEAEAVAAFCDDVLIANEIVAADKCARLAELQRKTRITVAVDSVTGIDTLAAAAREAGVRVGVLVDVNVGQNRCGVTPDAQALDLARRVADSDGLELRGVMGYEGHAQPIRDRTEREEVARDAMGALTATADELRAAGLPCDVVSAGGTGTFDISGRFTGITEIQAGSYALMDSDYGEVHVPFEHAFWVLGTVISRPSPDRCVADCGHKALTKDHGLPEVNWIAGAVVTALNDEHATIALPPGASIAVGDRIQLVPSHTDPTVNLHDVFYVVEGDRVIHIWPIERGYAEQRSARMSSGKVARPRVV